METERGEGPRLVRRRRTGPLGWCLRGIVALVLLELALQLAAPIYRAIVARDDEPAAADAPLTVLCVGDSHTFGLGVSRAFGYPDRLAALLDRRFRAPVAVVNRGVPGQNSAQVAAALETDLGDVDPDLVLVLAGINDTWNRDAEAADAAALLGRLKLVRLVRVLLAGVTTAGRFEVRSDDRGRIVVDRGAGERPVNMGAGAVGVRAGGELAASVQTHLRHAVGLVRDHGARPVLLTYGEFQGDFADVNEAVRQLAQAEDVQLVDLERDFAALFATHGYESLMQNDHHPNARGYALMASEIDRTLAEAGCVPPRIEGQASDSAASLDFADVTAVLRCDEQGRLLASGPPDWPFQVLIAAPATTEGGFDVGGRHVPLREDALLALSRVEPAFSGRLDSTGGARIEIPAALRQAGAGSEWSACLLLLSQSAETPIAAVSPAVAIRF